MKSSTNALYRSDIQGNKMLENKKARELVLNQQRESLFTLCMQEPCGEGIFFLSLSNPEYLQRMQPIKKL